MDKLIFRKVPEGDIQLCAEMVRKYSWGDDYPVDPLIELQQAEYIIGCFDGEKLIGFGSITKVASPDGRDNGKPWFADAVVLPEYRGRGVYKKLYQERLAFLRNAQEHIAYTCTDNPFIEKFMVKQGWKADRITKDESGEDCKVFTRSLV